MKTKTYKYYSPSLSRFMLPALDRHLSKIGVPQVAEARCVGRDPRAWYGLVIRGTTGKLVLKGCSWGYGGEGPHATRDVLLKLGAGGTAVLNRVDNVVTALEGNRTLWTRTFPTNAAARRFMGETTTV